MKICIIGSGYVGLVSGTCFSELGNNVICVDNNKQKIENLKKGVIPIFEPGLEELIIRNVKQKRLNFSTDVNNSIRNSDIIFICVGTPTNKNSNKANLKYVYKVVSDIKKNLNKYKIIVTKSTVPVTTGDQIEKILESKNKIKFDVVSNPEFLREGEAIRDFMYPDRVVIGTNSKKANNIMKNLYLPLIKKKNRYFHTTRRAAELDNRIGDRFLRAGPGYGGSCFPKDTSALVSTSKQFKTNLSIVKSVINSNKSRYKILLNKINKIMKNKLKSKNITFLGVTFKPGTDDMREATSLKLIPYLINKGSNVSYYEPTGIKSNFNNNKVKYINNIKDACKKADLIIIHTEWNEFKQLNLKKISNKKNYKIYDLRNLYSPEKMKEHKVSYFSIGR